MTNQQCSNIAEWWLTEGPGPDENTVSCTEHLSVMVSDQTSNIAAYESEEQCCFVTNTPTSMLDRRIAELEAERDEYHAMRDNVIANGAVLDRQRCKRIAELEAAAEIHKQDKLDDLKTFAHRICDIIRNMSDNDGGENVASAVMRDLKEFMR